MTSSLFPKCHYEVITELDKTEQTQEQGKKTKITLQPETIASVIHKYFSYFSTKTYVVGTHYNCLSNMLLMSTHLICLHEEIRKNTKAQLFKTNNVVS